MSVGHTIYWESILYSVAGHGISYSVARPLDQHPPNQASHACVSCCMEHTLTMVIMCLDAERTERQVGSAAQLASSN